MSGSRTWISVFILALAVVVAGSAKPVNPRAVEFTKRKDTVDVLVGGKLFTRYVFSGAAKPYLYPIIGPTGQPVTRHYPMKQVPGESGDHPHQKSLWYTFGSVNGIDFWAETPKSGKIIHRKFDKLKSTPGYGWIRETNDWVGPDGVKVCEDTRDLRIYSSEVMDFSITVRATEGPLTFGDTKEGMFAVRVADSMTVDKGNGHIQLSSGETDAKAWGKRADWCDYYGPVDGQTVGIAILEHPTSFRHPTYWHVRTYGLMGANPFGIKEFSGDKTKDGAYTVPKGGSVTFKYRVIIHKGDTLQADIAGKYAAYVKQ